MLVNQTNGEKRFYPKYTITKGQKGVSGFSSTKKSIKTIAGPSARCILQPKYNEIV